jgi:hypothetical protein
MTSKNFEIAMRKGNVGEQIVRAHLESRGWVVYQPITDGPHCFDMLSIRDKRSAIALDVKAKARLNRYPATGINQKHFEEYAAFSEKHKMPFWLVFVDEMERQVYGNTLQELEIPREVEGVIYPAVMPWRPAIRIWPLAAMKVIANLDDSHCKELVALSQRRHDYKAA